MRILFLLRHFGYARNFESAIVALAERGHAVHLASERDETIGGREMVERIATRYPNVSIGSYPQRARVADARALRHLRLGTDYLRFLSAEYGGAPHLRARARDRAPERIVALSQLPVVRRRPVRRLLTLALRALERGAPASPALEAYVREQSPDVVLISPLVDLGSPQIDVFHAAQSAGLRTVLCVGSWDHLSSKALLRGMPDLVTVWNGTQKREAMRMHGVPAARVAVTGAQAYDHWFGWAPARTRAEFCRRVGLPPDKPFILYVCSSLFRGTALERVLVEKWIRRIRESQDPVLRSAGILIRPHPTRMDEWAGTDVSFGGEVAFWGAHPVDQSSKDDYFDSMYYASAVVGLNTSAFLEAAVLGKSVFTFLLPKYSKYNQEGTLHFRYLLEVNGGLLHVSHSFDEHRVQLAERLARPSDERDPKSDRFVEGFIRPQGLDVPSTPAFVDAIEALVARPPHAVARRPLSTWLAGRLWPTVVSMLDLRADPRPKLEKGVEARRPDAGAPPPQRQVSPLSPKVGKARDADKRLTGTEMPEALATRALAEDLGRGDGPILVGPWVSEAGFELLYWIPFVRWMCVTGALAPERLIVVSRGGSAPWYRPFAAHYEDIFSYMTPEEFRTRNDERVSGSGGRLKHTEVSLFDRMILDRVKERRGLAVPALLHPSAMYRLFHLFWMQHAPVTVLESFTSFALIPEAPEEAAIRRQLPERYVCAKFYANTALPDVPENRAFVAGMLERLTASSDVVLLDSGVRFDDHDDYPRIARSRLHPLDRLMTPENNLAVQTAAVRGAQAYVGTYGGFSYMAPLVGTDALTFYSHPQGFRFDHLEVAKRVFAGLGGGGFVEVDVRRLNALQAAFGHDALKPVLS